MVDLPAELQQQLFLGTPASDLRAGQDYGPVVQLWMDPRRHRVLGFICRQGQLGSRFSVFKLDQLQAIAPESIAVLGEPSQPDPRRLQSLPSLLGLPVWTDEGNFLGKIADCCFATASGRIRCYVLRGSGWRRLVEGRYELPPEAIRDWTPGRITVSSEAVDQLKQVQPGLRDAVQGLGDRLQSKYRQQWDEVHDQARAWGEEVKGVGDRARHWLEEIQLESPGADFAEPPELDWAVELPVAPSIRPGEAEASALDDLEDWDDFADLWPEAEELSPSAGSTSAATQAAVQRQIPAPPMAQPQAPELPPLPSLERKPRSQSPLIPPEDLESDDPWI